jgi:hypothetical protein
MDSYFSSSRTPTCSHHEQLESLPNICKILFYATTRMPRSLIFTSMGFNFHDFESNLVDKIGRGVAISINSLMIFMSMTCLEFESSYCKHLISFSLPPYSISLKFYSMTAFMISTNDFVDEIWEIGPLIIL